MKRSCQERYSHFVELEQGVVVAMLCERVLDLFDAFVVLVGPVAVDVELGEARQVKLDGGSELKEHLAVQIAVLHLNSLKSRVGAVCESAENKGTAFRLEEAVGEVERLELGPFGQTSGDGARTSESSGVVLKIEDLEIGTGGEAVADGLDSFHTDTVLEHADLDQPAVSCVCFGPHGCRAILETVTSADNGAKLGLETLCLEVLSSFIEGICNDGTTGDAEAVVVELEDGEAVVVLEEVDHGLSGSATEGVVGEVELHEAGVVCESIAEGSKRVGNLGDQSTCEDVGKVGDLCMRHFCTSGGTGRGRRRRWSEVDRHDEAGDGRDSP